MFIAWYERSSGRAAPIAPECIHQPSWFSYAHGHGGNITVDINLLVQHKIYFAPGYELDLVFLKSEEAQKVNLEFRNKKYTTDVLSFSYGEKHYGELVFCPDVILKNSKDHGLSYAQELMYMMIYGLLHLHGYDHEKSKKRAKEMFRIQDKIFSDLLKIYGQSI